MKKRFVDPELDVLKFSEDILLTTSGGSTDGGGEADDGSIGLPGIDF